MKVNFNDMTPATKEWMDAHGYFAGGPCYDVDKPAKHGRFEYGGAIYETIVGHYDGEWFAEVEDGDGAAVETRTNVHPDLAIMEALCFVVARTALAEEGNCEDAVNRVGYEVLALMLRGDAGKGGTDEAAYFFDAHETWMLDVCLGFARRAVRFFAGDEWEEF